MDGTLKVSSEELSPTKKRLEVEIPPPRVQEMMEALCRDLNRRVRVKGFRPGRTPKEILERQYGDYIREQVISSLIKETYPLAISQASVEPIAPPIIDTGELRPGEAFTYSAVVEVRPCIVAKGYKGMRLVANREGVTTKEVAAELERLRQMHAQLRQAEGRDRVRAGDIILLDFQGFLGGRPIRDGKGENYLLEIGSGTMVPGFEEGLIGKKIGTEDRIKVVFPSDHPRKELAGKEVTFKVFIKEIRERVLPKLDDEFAKDVGAYKDLGELKARIREQLEKIKDRKATESLREAVIDKLLEANPIEIPSSIVAQRAAELLNDLRLRIGRLSPEQEREAQAAYERIAERDVKASFLLEAVGKQESIELSEQEVERKLQEMANLYQWQLEQVRQNAPLVAAIRRGLWRDKVLDFIISHADVKYK